jgi:hypothetical protein
MTAHAVFSPSAAHRWFNCPGSINLIASLPAMPAVSVYASEGSAAHALAADCLTHGEDCSDYLGEKFVADGQEFVVDETMAEAVQVFVNFVRDKVNQGYQMRVEVRLDLGHLWPGQFGTGDCVLYHEEFRDLIVVDLKYGRGVVVDVEDNAQLLSYASGAWYPYKDFSDAPVPKHDIKAVTVVIIQPRAVGVAPIRMMSVPLPRLSAFEDEFRAAALKASAPGAALVPGSWCQFCAAAAICPALKDRAHAIARLEFASVPPPVSKLSAEEIGAVLDSADLIESWIEAVRKEGLRRALAGESVPTGWKVVRKNTHRKWIDEDKAASVLATVYELDEDDVWTKKIVSPAQAEKLVGKGNKEGLSTLIRKPPGDPMLAPETDSREALKVDIASEFGTRQVLQESVKLLTGAVLE